eukprot:28534_3
MGLLEGGRRRYQGSSTRRMLQERCGRMRQGGSRGSGWCCWSGVWRRYQGSSTRSMFQKHAVGICDNGKAAEGGLVCWEMEEQAEGLVQRLNSQQVANTLWALATRGR